MQRQLGASFGFAGKGAEGRVTPAQAGVVLEHGPREPPRLKEQQAVPRRAEHKRPAEPVPLEPRGHGPKVGLGSAQERLFGQNGERPERPLRRRVAARQRRHGVGAEIRLEIRVGICSITRPEHESSAAHVKVEGPAKVDLTARLAVRQAQRAGDRPARQDERAGRARCGKQGQQVAGAQAP